MRAILVLASILLVAMALVSSRAASTASSAEQPVIVSFTATPHKIKAGDSVTLNWEVRGVRSLSIDWAPAAATRDHWQHHPGLPPSGSLVMRPVENTVFVLTCDDSGGLTCASASVNVELKP